MKEMFKPDHSNLKRGFVLVGLAILLGLFMSVQVLTEPDDGISTANDEIASPTVSLASSSTTSRTVSQSAVVSSSTTVDENEASSSTTVEDETTSTTERATTATTERITTTTAEPTTTAAPVESGVAVQVLNGARFSGVASAATDILQNSGFDPVTPGDTPVVYNESTVFYRSGFATTAAAIGDDLNIDNTVQMNSGNQPIDDVEDLDSVVVVGRDETIPR